MIFCEGHALTNLYVSAQDGNVYFFDIGELPTPNISRIKISSAPLGVLASSNFLKTLYVCIPSMGKVVAVIGPGVTNQIVDIAIPTNGPNMIAEPLDISVSPDQLSAYLVSAMRDLSGNPLGIGNLCKIDLNTNQAVIIKNIPDGEPVAVTVNSAFPDNVYVAQNDDQGVFLDTILKGEIVNSWGVSNFSSAQAGLVISPDGILYLSCDDGDDFNSTITKFDISDPSNPLVVTNSGSNLNFPLIGQLAFSPFDSSKAWAPSNFLG